MFKIKEKRTHDNFYLKEKFKIKDYYKFILKKSNVNLNGKKVIDVGCSNGDFLNYVKIKFPESKRFGLEVNKKLCALTKKRNVASKILNTDIFKLDKKYKFDYIFVSGVHSIFDSLSPLFSKLKNMMQNKKSQIFIFGIWNPYDVDVLVRLKKNNDTYWEKGWNIFSLTTAKKQISGMKLDNKIYKFELKKILKKQNKDLFRSWSLSSSKDRNIIINGSNLIHNFYLIKIYKK